MAHSDESSELRSAHSMHVVCVAYKGFKGERRGSARSHQLGGHG